MLRTTLPFVLLASTPALAANIRYEVVDLGLTAEHSDVCACFFTNAINESNAAAGFFFGTDGDYNAFVADATDGMIDISNGVNRTFARGINDAGHVVGWTTEFSFQSAFLWNGSTKLDLGTPGGSHSDANDINNAGQVVGDAAWLPDDNAHASLWQDGSWTDLGTLDDAPISAAEAINENGMIVGSSWNAAWDRRAVYWTADLEGPFELPSFSDPERFTYANGLNDAGTIVGQIEVDPIENLPAWRAVKWIDNSVIDLGLLPEAGEGVSAYLSTAFTSAAARDINAGGVIVGNSFPAAETPEVRFGPFVYDNDRMINLNDLLAPGHEGWMIHEASSINDSGAIGASATSAEGHRRAVVLVPIELPVGDIDGDGAVTFADLVALLAAWGPCEDSCLADIDFSGAVDFNDLLTLLANWG